MLFSYNWLNDYLIYKVSPQELAEVLTMHAFEVESVMKKGEDWVLDIDVLSNRAADCFSHTGVAREANALLGFLGRYEKKKAKPFYDEKEIKAFFVSLAPARGLSVTVERREDCPLYHLLLIRDVVVKESPLWMKKRLEVVGLNSINNLVDSSNYVMLDTGEPLHMFDADEVADKNKKKEVIVRRAREGEKLILLGGEGVSLSANDLVIADAQKALALAGIKGGEETGVKKKTRSILIEAASFNRSLLYETSKRLHILSDSAKRWGAGVLPDVSFIGLFNVQKFVTEMTGGMIASHYSVLPPTLPHNLFSLRPPIFVLVKRLQSLIGKNIPVKTMHAVLFHLGFEVKEEAGDAYKIFPPFWRLDCEREEDIAEEVARCMGLNDIAPVFPSVSLQESLDQNVLAWRSFIKHYFISQGFDEVYSYSLVSENDKNAPLLLNPISAERSHLRGDLIKGLLEAIARNQAHHASLKLFEMGNTFLQERGVIKERERLAGIVWHRTRGEAFREAKGYLAGLVEAMGFDEEDYRLTPASSDQLPDTSVLNVSVNGERIGRIAILETPKELKVKGVAAGFELDVQALVQNADEEREFEEPPKYPAVERDISLFLERGVKAGSIMQVIHEVGKELIEDVDLLDMYEEEGKPQKSLAFHIVYRSKKKTLRDEEVNILHQKIEKALTKRFHAKIR